QELLVSLSDSNQSGQLYTNAAEALASQFFNHLTMLPGSQFSQSVCLDRIDPDTVLEKRASTICRVLQNDAEAPIEFAGHRVAGPARIAAALRFVTCTDRFAVHEMPGELNEQSKVVLARRLIREGLLIPSTEKYPLEQPEHQRPHHEATLSETDQELDR